MLDTETGRLVIVSGPSGVGKTTVMQNVIRRAPVPLVASVSATTRPPRPDEIDGRDYHFLSQQEFDRLNESGEFLECFEVFGRGYWYGTLRREVATGLKAGKWVILMIDVNGAMAVLEQCPDAITIFIRSGAPEELERRLRGRGTETPEALNRRLAEAKIELAQADRYQYQVVNDDIDRAVDQICTILTDQWKRNRND
jgi:guanylate kinase